MADFHPPWAAQKVRYEGLPYALAHGAWRGETAILDAQGREVAMSQVILPHRGADGKIEAMSTIAHDVSERKAVERLKVNSSRLFPMNCARH